MMKIKIIEAVTNVDKTAALLALSAESEAVLIVENGMEAAAYAGLAESKELQIPYPLTFTEYRNGIVRRKGKERICKVIIESLEDFFSMLVPPQYEIVALGCVRPAEDLEEEG